MQRMFVVGEFTSEPRLAIQNSYGRGVGSDGIHYFGRNVINRDFVYGAIMFVDMEHEIIKEQYALKQGDGMSKLKRFWEWIIKSSADPTKVSLTVKSMLFGILPIVVVITKLLNVEIAEGDLQTFIDALEASIIAVFGAVSSIGVVVGLVRKIYLTFKK